VSKIPRSNAPDARRRRPWILLAAAILVLGLAVSLAAGLLWRSSVHTHEVTASRTVATNVGETVQTLLRRDTDFLGTLRAVLTMQPDLSQSSFDRWYTELEGRQRQVGSLGTTIVRSVPAAELSSFLARRNADPTFRALVGGKILPVQTSTRARYCLVSTSESIVGQLSEPVSLVLQGDWCLPSSAIGKTQAPLQQAATDSGQTLVLPVVAEGLHTLLFETAFYRPGAALATVAARRAAVAGWIVSSFDVRTVISAGVGGNRSVAVSLYHTNPGGAQELVGESGRVLPGARFTQTSTHEIEGRWIVKLRVPAATSGLSSTAQGLLVLVGGAIVSVLLAALQLVLTRSRERALGMVEEKTGQLRHQALHDSLTGLPNRVLALDRAAQMLARARRQPIPVAALYVDIDGFKHVNDTFGHAAGDELLRIVATRLTGVVREGDTAARLGGDEFVVLVEGATLDAGPELIAERLLDVLRQSYDMRPEISRQLSLTASIGVASGTRDSADELLRDADLALYQAKAAGRNRYTLFSDDMQTVAQDRLTLEMDLAEALEHEQLFLLYQPTFDLRSERVIGVEALIRWRHPTRGVISPVEFIPIAEESGLIVPIGRWVLEEACEQAATWHGQGHGLSVAVNVSARQLDSDELIVDVRHALRSSGLEPASLTLEVTETALMRDAEATAERLRSLKQLGVRIAIDDFGTGYSSLAYLRQFPADALKIDRSFVSSIATSKQSTALIHTLVQLGKALQLETLAEGIEDHAQLHMLQREHCDQGQGFLFSRPLEVSAIEAFLERAEPAPLSGATL
jgi:diguanylate cyclase (GGDEF)-like protein